MHCGQPRQSCPNLRPRREIAGHSHLSGFSAPNRVTRGHTPDRGYFGLRPHHWSPNPGHTGSVAARRSRAIDDHNAGVDRKAPHAVGPGSHEPLRRLLSPRYSVPVTQSQYSASAAVLGAAAVGLHVLGMDAHSTAFDIAHPQQAPEDRAMRGDLRQAVGVGPVATHSQPVGSRGQPGVPTRRDRW